MSERKLGEVENNGYVMMFGRSIPITHRGFSYYIEHSQTILEYLTQPDTLILDLGAGDSSFGPIVNSKSSKYKADVIRFDYSYADRALTKTGNAVAGDARSMPFFNEIFNLVICNHLLMHLSPDEMTPMIAEAFRVLKPSGQMHIRPLRSNFNREDISMIYGDVSINPQGTLVVTKPDDYNNWSEQEMGLFNNFVAENCTSRQ
jgi:ubiquinone/menaquinone biosynthesis C-methylase UbiE